MRFNLNGKSGRPDSVRLARDAAHLRESREAARGFLDEGDFKNAAREFLFQAEFSIDSADRVGDLRMAQVCATLAHVDALELVRISAVEALERNTDSNAEVSAQIRRVA